MTELRQCFSKWLPPEGARGKVEKRKKKAKIKTLIRFEILHF